MVALSLGIKSGTPQLLRLLDCIWYIPAITSTKALLSSERSIETLRSRLLSSGETSTTLVVLLSLIPMVMSKSAGWLLGDNPLGSSRLSTIQRPEEYAPPSSETSSLTPHPVASITVAYDGGWME